MSRKRYTESEICTIREMIAQRHSFREIADEIGRTRLAISRKCSLMGLKSIAIQGRKSDAADGLQCIGMITVRLPQKLHERLAKHCERNRVSMNEFVAALIEGQV
jgi:IS30 family transposase